MANICIRRFYEVPLELQQKALTIHNKLGPELKSHQNNKFKFLYSLLFCYCVPFNKHKWCFLIKFLKRPKDTTANKLKNRRE